MPFHSPFGDGGKLFALLLDRGLCGASEKYSDTWTRYLRMVFGAGELQKLAHGEGLNRPLGLRQYRLW